MPNSENPILIGGALLCVTAISVIAIASQNEKPEPATQFQNQRVEYIDVTSYRDLENVFKSPTDNTLTITRELPGDLNSINSPKKKKNLFVRTLTPIIILENQRIKEERGKVLLLLNNKQWPQDEKLLRNIKVIAKRYGVSNQNAKKTYEALLSRADEVPLQLVLAQAAIESGWGTSRFAQEGNSLFGQWSFAPNSGLTPKDRTEGLTHTVKAFKDIQASVRAYMLNINTNHAYRELRDMRSKMREEQQPLDAKKLAEGLYRYSQRKHEYVKELKQLISQSVISNAIAQGRRD